MTGPPTAGGAAGLAQAAPFLPAAGLLAVWIAWIPNEGGYFARDWYPAAIFLVALLAAVAIAGGRLLPRTRAARVALALLAAITAWCFVSLLWSETPGNGWAASDQMLLYLATAWLAALVPWRSAPAMRLIALWSAAVAVVCVVELVSALDAPRLGHYILESRWQQPTSYANAAAGLATMAALGPLMLAARRGVPAYVGVPMLALAAFLVQFSLLPQSRGTVVGVLVALPVFVLLAPDRWRLVARFLVVGVALAVSGDALWDVYGAGEDDRPLGAALDRAARELLLGTVVALVLGGVLALAERVVRPGPRAAVAARRGGLVAAGAVALVAVGIAAANAGEIRDYASDRWSDFSSEKEVADPNPSRLAQRSSDKRYDYWRVSLRAFRDAPIGGLGAGGFEREYARERRHEKPSRAAHSLWMRALAETGIVGAALLLGFVAVVAAGLVAARRRLGGTGRAVVAACAGVGAYFISHASVDWLELLPALAAPGLALPFIALELRDRGVGGAETPRAAPALAEDEVAPRAAPARGARARVLTASAVGVFAALALAALALPYLSLRYTEHARSHPSAADRDLRRARALNPLSSEPRILEGRIAVRQGRFAAAERAFAEALDAEDVWYPHFALALLHSRAGRFDAATRAIARARALNPPDPFVERAAELIGQRRRIDPRRVSRATLRFPLYNVARQE